MMDVFMDVCCSAIEAKTGAKTDKNDFFNDFDKNQSLK